jgi:hypothetical protein
MNSETPHVYISCARPPNTIHPCQQCSVVADIFVSSTSRWRKFARLSVIQGPPRCWQLMSDTLDLASSSRDPSIFHKNTHLRRDNR